MKKVRVLLADDHPLTLEGLRVFLEPHLESVGTAGDGVALVDAALRLKPDLVISDITMPLISGIAAGEQILKHRPGTRLMFVTMHVSPAYLEAALHAGATGYVLKSAAREELLEAIRTVMDGRIYVSPGLVSPGLAADLGHFGDPEQAAATLRLSLREREVLQLVAAGRTTKEVAFTLTISVKTVAFHRDNIRRKLGLRSTAELTKYALEEGLIQ